jgi:hypothetical protein
VGSFLVAVSLMMNSLWRLRWINLAGASVFSVYGLIVGAYPVAVVNGFIVLIDIYYLWQMSKDEEYFSLLPIARRDNSYLKRFLEFHSEDINNYFPDFDIVGVKGARMVFILRNMTPAGLVVFTEEQNEAHIYLDYVLPQYRDMRCAKYFMEHMKGHWLKAGIKRLSCPTGARVHGKYLEKLGFKKICENGETQYYRNI